MLRGLALRQTFIVANILLILALGVLVAATLREFLATPPDIGSVSSPLVRGASEDEDLGGVQPRDNYDLIVSSRLFGSAARYDPRRKPATETSPPVEPPPSEVTEETKLPLKLFGTSVSGVGDLFAVAIIEVRQGGTRTKAFYLGQEIMSNVFLKEVRRKEVVIDNRRNRRMENLTLDRSEANPQGSSSPRAFSAGRPVAARVGTRPQMITLDRADITKRMEEEYARLASTIDIKVVKDDQGRIQGVTTDNIESIELAAELGFKNGDILTSINNEPVDSQEKGAQIIQKYRNASIFRIGILRDGQPLYINYRVR